MRYIIALLVLLFAVGASAQVTYTETPIQAPLQFVNETGTPLNLGDDNTRLIPLDFSFTFFGNTYNSVYISSNGFLSFTNSANGCCNGNPLPSSFANSIFALWTDLISNSNPYYFSSADIFTAGWYNTNEFGTNNLFNFEISLFPNNDVLINYGNMANLSGHVGTAGIQGPNQEFVQIYQGSNFAALSGTGYLFNLAPLEPPVINCNDPEMVTNPECIHQLLSSISLPPADMPTFKSEPVQETPLETLLAVEPASEKEEASVDVVDIAMVVASAPTSTQTKSTKTASQASSSSTEDTRLAESGVMSDSIAEDQFTFNSQKDDASSTGSEDLVAIGGSFGSAGFTFLPSGPKNDSAATLEAIGVLKPLQERTEQTDNTSPGLYADQDQSAVLADINSNLGFNSYQSTMIFDASAWYKPEDIYKNNKVDDNKRGFYFMEKGSTDTYKQMVEGQYK